MIEIEKKVFEYGKRDNDVISDLIRALTEALSVFNWSLILKPHPHLLPPSKGTRIFSSNLIIVYCVA